MLSNAFKRCVIKLGSSILVPDQNLDEAYIRSLGEQIKTMADAGVECLVVSSGAIAVGLRTLGIKARPESIAKKQAIAAVGQIGLMDAYKTAFEGLSLTTAQILLTHEDFRDRSRFLNARHTIQELLEMGVVPIINENDSISSEEIKVGDNDNLAGMLACLIEADLLVLLTDIDGLYNADPRQDPDAKRIKVVEELEGEIEAFAESTTSPVGVGGMRTKIEAAKRAAGFHIPTVIAHGREPEILTRLQEGESLGTLILPAKGERLQAKKHWIRYVLKPKGSVTVDEGAANAISQSGKSLLPSGITAIEGDFEIGDPVEIFSPENKSIARGLTAYSSTEIAKIQGAKSKEIEALLGYRYCDEVIHRDELVLH
jgi:glutamate 5-kinase